MLQQGLKDLDRAFKNFFRRVQKGEKPGYPRFKKKGLHESFRFPQRVKVQGSQCFLPKIGWVKFRKSRDLQGNLNETTLIQEGKAWFISFSCEWEAPSQEPAPKSETKAVGIDVGINYFATLAIGQESHLQEILNPKY